MQAFTAFHQSLKTNTLVVVYNIYLIRSCLPLNFHFFSFSFCLSALVTGPLVHGLNCLCSLPLAESSFLWSSWTAWTCTLVKWWVSFASCRGKQWWRRPYKIFQTNRGQEKGRAQMAGLRRGCFAHPPERGSLKGGTSEMSPGWQIWMANQPRVGVERIKNGQGEWGVGMEMAPGFRGNKGNGT